MNKCCTFILLVIFFGTSFQGYCQDKPIIEQSKVIREIDGRSFYVHTIEKGHTLYSISKVYKVEIDTIVKYNPGSRESLSLGQELFIPIASQAESKEEVDPLEKYSGKFIRHFVKAKETLYSISRIYDVSVEDIIAANDGLKEGLKAGQYLKIPVLEESSLDQQPLPTGDASEKFDKYTVRAGEELFDIANRNQVSVDELNLFNPALKDGIHAGMVIRIPKKDQFEQLSPDFVMDTIWMEYKIKRGDKLDEIARLYKVDVNDIAAANPGIVTGMGKLPKNAILRIPLIKKTMKEKVSTVETHEPDTSEPVLGMALCTTDSSIREKTFKIALMLPLYAGDADTIMVDEYYQVEPAREYHVFRFVQFYEGFLMAVDSLEKQGLKAEVYVYDVGQDPEITREIVENELSKDLDLIVGPLYSNSFGIVSKFAGDHGINIVNPFTNRQGILINNPHVFKAYPSFKTRLEQLAAFCTEKYRDANFIVVHRDVEKETALADVFRNSLNSNLMLQGRPDSAYCLLQTWQSPGDAVKGQLSDTGQNVVIALSSDEIFVHNLIRSLNSDLKDTKITLFGMPAWRHMRNIENAYLMSLDLHLFSPVFIDYQDSNVLSFVKDFRTLYLTEPDTYAFQGFDLAYYFLSAMMNFGRNIEMCIPYYRLKTLQCDYHFVKSAGNGFENIFVNFYHYKDFSLKNARRVDPPEIE